MTTVARDRNKAAQELVLYDVQYSESVNSARKRHVNWPAEMHELRTKRNR